MVNKTKPVNRGQSIQTAHSSFKKTGNILYAVIAIGEKTPPPEWALEACKMYFEKANAAHTDIVAQGITDLKTAGYGDSAMLERVAELMLEEGMTELGAIKQALGDNAKDADIRRLQRKRAKEIRLYGGEDGEVLEDDPRTNRLLEKRAPPQSHIFKRKGKA
jgi:hypothetical protein